MKRCAECGLVASDETPACVGCRGQAFVAEPARLVDGRYAIEGELGAGSMGRVYLARDVGLDRQVALKRIAPGAAGEATEARFRREAAALARIRNEHVVQVYSFGPHGDSYYFAMEYVRGRNLEAIIEEHAAHGSHVPLARALTILAQVAEGLSAAHGAGVVHCDVKPANIVIEEHTGRPVLVDFGLAYRERASSSPGGVTMGTPAYMAPEQGPLAEVGARVTGAVDVYSFGCTAFDLLTNRPPFVAQSVIELLRQHAHVDPPRLSSFRPELGPLDPVIARALAKRPELRFRDFAELREALLKDGAAWMGALAPESPVERTEPFSAVDVLVVDDDEAFRRFAARAAQLALYRTAVRVTSVGSGEEAIAAARERRPHLVLLDYDMPRVDGVSTLSALRALPGGTDARVIVVSARAGAEERWKFGVLGVSDFVQKPVSLPALVDVLSTIAARNAWVGLAGGAGRESEG